MPSNVSLTLYNNFKGKNSLESRAKRINYKSQNLTK